MRVALIQTSASNSLQKNLKKTTSFVKDAADQGAELVCLQECLPHGFSRSVWEIELRAHAIANSYYVAGVNRVGTKLESEYYGARLFVDPIGEVIAQADDKETVLVVDLPRERIDEVRRVWPFFRDRRPDAYDAIIAP